MEASPLWMIRLAAWQPLLFAPGSRYHHSNIGWNAALGMPTSPTSWSAVTAAASPFYCSTVAPTTRPPPRRASG
jgi:hypothetical protein